MIHSLHFYEELRKGSSLPLLVGGDDGNNYVVKLNGAGDGVLSNIVEWVASKLGELLQIPVLQPVLVNIDANFAEQAGDPEARELLEKSVGINLGTPYLPGASTFTERYAQRIDDFLKQQVFLFDVFLLNVDRTEVNPNMIVHGGELRCLDYSSAMEIRNAINGERYRGEEWGFVCLRLSNHFDDPIDYMSPADIWGDVGAASGALFIMLACQAAARGHAKGPRMMLWASSESGVRVAAVIEAPETLKRKENTP